MHIKKIRPLHSQVLVELLDIDDYEAPKKIILMEQQNKKLQLGLVKAVGDGYLSDEHTYSPLKVQPGDRVIFTRFIGTKVGDSHLIVAEDKLLARLN